jgi:hypothetical protein
MKHNTKTKQQELKKALKQHTEGKKVEFRTQPVGGGSTNPDI